MSIVNRGIRCKEYICMQRLYIRHGHAIKSGAHTERDVQARSSLEKQCGESVESNNEG